MKSICFLISTLVSALAFAVQAPQVSQIGETLEKQYNVSDNGEKVDRSMRISDSKFAVLSKESKNSKASLEIVDLTGKVLKTSSCEFCHFGPFVLSNSRIAVLSQPKQYTYKLSLHIFNLEGELIKITSLPSYVTELKIDSIAAAQDKLIIVYTAGYDAKILVINSDGEVQNEIKHGYAQSNEHVLKLADGKLAYASTLSEAFNNGPSQKHLTISILDPVKAELLSNQKQVIATENSLWWGHFIGLESGIAFTDNQSYPNLALNMTNENGEVESRVALNNFPYSSVNKSITYSVNKHALRVVNKKNDSVEVVFLGLDGKVIQSFNQKITAPNYDLVSAGVEWLNDDTLLLFERNRLQNGNTGLKPVENTGKLHIVTRSGTSTVTFKYMSDFPVFQTLSDTTFAVSEVDSCERNYCNGKLKTFEVKK